MSSRSARVFARSLVSTAERERHAMIESTASSERRAAGFAAASSSTACSTADPIRARACRHAELDGRYLDDGIGGAVSLAFELCLDELARDALELEVDGSTDELLELAGTRSNGGGDEPGERSRHGGIIAGGSAPTRRISRTAPGAARNRENRHESLESPHMVQPNGLVERYRMGPPGLEPGTDGL
jgi:hypothetical protein